MRGIEHNPRCASLHIGPWFIEPRWFCSAVAAFKAGSLPVIADIEARSADVSQRKPYVVDRDGIATLLISGHMTKGDSKYGGTNSVRVRQASRMVNSDEEVGGVMIVIDSPGGSVAGTEALGDDIAAITKPKHSFIEDLGASAAYWAASQTEHITVNPTGEVGSIGTLAIIDDESKKYEAEGIKTHIISTGEYKGALVPGVEITENAIGVVREIVGAMNDRFLQAVSRGRNMSMKDVQAIATGRTWVGQDAKARGLVDAVGSADQAYDYLASLIDKKSSSEGRKTASAETRIRLAKSLLTCGQGDDRKI